MGNPCIITKNDSGKLYTVEFYGYKTTYRLDCKKGDYDIGRVFLFYNANNEYVFSEMENYDGKLITMSIREATQEEINLWQVITL